MQLKFNREYKSIKHSPAQELPSFTVITGANGAGKTHLLEAILNGSIKVDSLGNQDVRYYNWAALVTPDQQAVQPRGLENNRNSTCTAIADFCNAYKENILQQILVDYKQRFPGSVAVSVTNQQILDAVGRLTREDFWKGTAEDVIAHYVNSTIKAFSDSLEQSRIHGQIGIGYRNANNQYINKTLSRNNVLILKHIIDKSEKPFFALTEAECLRYYPLFSDEQDPFIGSITSLFAGYVLARMVNATNKTLAIDFGTPVHYLSQKEFLEQNGPEPWNVFNQVLSEAKLGFRFKEPSPDASVPMQVQLYHTLSEADIKFSDLSSGERVLISLAHFLFFSQDSRQPTSMPALILLDEVDAPLHPSMTVDLLRTIKNIMVEQYGRKVILATHSPSTVALAPEESIHVMDVNTKLLRKMTRDEGVQALTVGVPILSINIANRRQVFVESQHDVLLYERIAEVARPHLAPDISLSFMAAGHEKNGGCGLLISLVKQLNEAGNRAVYGIVDWDGTRTADGNLRVLGESMRHSIENYLLDPILIGALLLREKAKALYSAAQSGLPLLEGKENYFNLGDFSDERLQRIANAVFAALNISLQDVIPVRYVNNRVIQVPQEYLITRGHDLEARIRATFEELKRFHQEPLLKKEILHKILEDIPELLPYDFVILLNDIQIR